MNREVFFQYSTWKEFKEYVKEIGFEGQIPYVFDKIRDDDLLTPNDIAEVTGYSEETIRRWCRSWKLKTMTGRPPYTIKGEDLKEFLFTWTRNDFLKNL